MAEQATRVADAESGDYIATRPAYENDEGGNPRMIQLIDWAGRQLESVLTLRGGTTPVSVPDGVDLTVLGDITDSILVVGDKTSLIVFPEHSVNDGTVLITPLVLDVANNVIAVRAAKSSGMSADALFQYGSGNFASPQLQWDTMGAVKIALHITKIEGAGNTIVLKGGLI